MRDIKFKAKVNNEWIVSNGFIKHPDGTITIITKENSENVETSPIVEGTLCEFTGLKDKNNKDIYEGDLMPDDIGDVYEVVFRNGAFMWAGEFLGYHLWGNPDCDVKIEACEAIDLEVIGNIHEDSELIKTTS